MPVCAQANSRKTPRPKRYMAKDTCSLCGLALRKMPVFNTEPSRFCVSSARKAIAYPKNDYKSKNSIAIHLSSSRIDLQPIPCRRPYSVAPSTLQATSSAPVQPSHGPKFTSTHPKPAPRNPPRTRLGPILTSTGATAGVHPRYMGLGPIPAARQALRKAGLHMGDMQIMEINEAFAAQSLAVIRELEIDQAKVNVNGGAIALGHPVGASGCRILVTLLHEMNRRDLALGLATLCVGGGMGVAAVIRRQNC